MLYRIVRPMRRKGTSNAYFVQRIPADVKDRAAGLKLALPVGPATVLKIIPPGAVDVRLSLRTRDPSEAKRRQGEIAGYLESVWQALRQDEPASLSHRQVTALAGELYRAWADEGRTRTTAVVHNPATGLWNHAEDATGEDAEWAATAERWAALRADDLDPHLGPVVDRLLLSKGLGRVDTRTRNDLLHAFWLALRDAFDARQRKAEGDYRPDPKSERFPAWEAPGVPARSSLTGLVDAWWKEAKASGTAVSTYESYRNTVRRFTTFLGHDDAGRVTAEDVIGFKDHRLASGVSTKTVKDSDLAGLRSLFRWAVANRRTASNPAEGITLKVGKQVRTRSKGFTEEEAAAILSHAARHKRGKMEHAKTFAAKRWAPWLCAYTGARVGEILQLRKQDVRRQRINGGGEHWVITITPEAGTVKNREAREIPLHPHLVELGFPAFVEAAPDGHLFLTPDDKGEVRGRWRTMKNRVVEFVREVVSDPNVAPNHGWRHLFKTIGFEAGIQERVLDAICGHAPRTVGAMYGEVTLRAKADAVAMFPRFAVQAPQAPTSRAAKR